MPRSVSASTAAKKVQVGCSTGDPQVPAPTPYPNPQTPYPSRVRVCITHRWTWVVTIPVSPRGYPEPATAFHTHDHTNIPCMSRDTPVLTGAVTNAVTRARWPSSTCRHGHQRRMSPSWVDGRPSSVIRLPSSLSVIAIVCLPSVVVWSSSSVVIVIVASSPLLSSSEWDSQLTVTKDDNAFEWCPRWVFLCHPHRGAAWLLLCRHTARQFRWASEEAATHLCWVVGVVQVKGIPAPFWSYIQTRTCAGMTPGPTGTGLITGITGIVWVTSQITGF